MGSEVIYKMVTEQITSALEKGVVPWKKPWLMNPAKAARSYNTNAVYRGINQILLSLVAESEVHTMPYWITRKQIFSRKGKMKKGSRTVPIIFWNWREKEVKSSDGTTKKENIPFLRYYRVFNIGDTEGIKLPEQEPVKPYDKIQVCEDIVKAMPNCPEIRHGNNRSFYHPTHDHIGLPEPSRFESIEKYYCVLFHELVHSTMHKDRMGRMVDTFELFHKESYSKEELVAEIGAAFLCGKAGIADSTIENSEAYIAGWLKALGNDHKFITQAAGQAQKVVDYILKENFAECKVAA